MEQTSYTTTQTIQWLFVRVVTKWNQTPMVLCVNNVKLIQTRTHTRTHARTHTLDYWQNCHWDEAESGDEASSGHLIMTDTEYVSVPIKSVCPIYAVKKHNIACIKLRKLLFRHFCNQVNVCTCNDFHIDRLQGLHVVCLCTMKLFHVSYVSFSYLPPVNIA